MSAFGKRNRRRNRRKFLRPAQFRRHLYAKYAPQTGGIVSRMQISQHCQLFIFSIFIGIAALLLPKIVMANPSVLTCGKTSFRLNEAAGTVAHHRQNSAH